MTRNISNRYTTVEALTMNQGERDLAELCDKTGASAIDDEVVMRTLLDIIYTASREVDGYLLGHMTIPIAEEEVALTVATSITLTNGSHDVAGVGCAFDTELVEGDEIQASDDEDYWFGVVDTITDANNLVLKYQYNGVTVAAATAAIRRRIVVPGWIETRIRDVAIYLAWERSGRRDENNPWAENTAATRLFLTQFQRSGLKFTDTDGVRRKDNITNSIRVLADRTMTSTTLARWRDPG